MNIIKDHWLGLPKNLLWGYIAIFLFMTGDGFELAFLSRYIIELGFHPPRRPLPLPFMDFVQPLLHGGPASLPK